MFSSNDSFQTLLQATFDANYNPKLSQRDPFIPDHHERHFYPADKISPPSDFYDQHIGTSYILKNVVHMPSLPQLLGRTCDDATRDFVAKRYQFSSTGYEYNLDIPGQKFSSAGSVRDHYAKHIGSICHVLASKLSVHPGVDTWNSIFTFTEDSKADTYSMAEGHLAVNQNPFGDRFFPTVFEKGLSAQTKNTFVELFDKFPKLAIWHMFPMLHTFISLFQDMTGDMGFSWQTSRTQGYETTSYAVPPLDAKSLSSKLPAGNMSSTTRAGDPKERKIVTKAMERIIAPEPLLNQVDEDDEDDEDDFAPELRHYLQHAWARAAIYDTTYIILHCGRFERIGIRHRESQTLYLSGLIDTATIRNPSYRKLHIGLYIAIVQDALERKRLADTLLQKPMTTSTSPSKKRSADGLEEKETSKSKRRRACVPEARIRTSPNVFTQEMIHRKLGLVNLDYGAFCSIVPSSFKRIGESCMRDTLPEFSDWTSDRMQNQKEYHIRDSFVLRLQAPLGLFGHSTESAVHPAQAELALESGEVLRENLVFKLAFTETKKEILKEEFRTYCRLFRADGVEGVVDVHGLFQDVETGALGLLIADGGKTLREREIQRTGAFAQQVTTTWQERKAFLSALESLHKAGIRHHDIKADNLLIDSDGHISIIDFEFSDGGTDEQLATEITCLKDVLHGKFERGKYYWDVY